MDHNISQKQTKKILIAEDSQAIRVAFKEILSTDSTKYDFLESDNGLDAIKKFRDYKPDLTILDVYLPGVDGIKVLKGMLQLDPDAKIIITTATGKANLAIHAKVLGAKDYLLKPLDRYRVLNVIGKNIK